MAVSGRIEDLTRSVLTASEEDNKFYCNPCEHDGHHIQAEGYCVDCQEYLCSVCYKVHCRPAICRHHRLQDKQSMPKVKPESTVKDVCTEICQKHRKVIEYFCNSHGDFGCSACMTTQHRACEKVDFIPESAAIFWSSKEMKDLKRKLSKLLTANEKNKSTISQNSKTVVLLAERAKLQVKNLREKITKLFDRLEKKIDNSIEDLKEGDEKNMMKLANETDTISQKLQKHINDMESYLNEKKMCQLFIKAKGMNKSLNDFNRRVTDMTESSKIHRYQFTPDEIIVDMMEDVENIGALDIMYQHAKVPKFERDINVRAETDEYECEISGIALLTKQLLVAVDYKNKSIKTVEMARNRLMSSYKMSNGMTPFDVTKLHVAQIAATYPLSKTFHFLDVSASGSMTMQREINAKGSCYGIECMGDNLIVSFSDPPAVKILTMTGAVVRTIDLGEKMFGCDYVAGNPLKNLVYVSNWVSDRPGSVICITSDGVKKAVVEDYKLQDPHGASVDKHGVVYVCERFQHSVVMLSEDCSIIQVLLNEDDALNKPTCLALCRKNDKLYVGMDGDMIKVFKLY